MADITKRLPDCENEGERGRRGKRGHRGHQGSVGPAGPTGPAGDTTPTPPFGDDVVITIFARASGSDETGDGKSPATAYRTFQRAVRDVPFFVPPGFFYDVDYTGIGIELLPDNYELPAWKGSHAHTFDADNPLYRIRTTVKLFAFPQLASALSPSNQVISSGTITQDPDTGIVTITDPTKTWPTDGSMKGLFSVGANAKFELGVIYDNTATSISITKDFVPTLPVSIMEPSAELRGNVTQGGFARGALNVSNQDSLAICGTRVVELSGDQGVYQQGGQVWYQLCDLPIFAMDTPLRLSGHLTCNLDNPLFGGELYLDGCRVANGGTFGDWLFRSANEEFAAFNGTVFDQCATIQVVNTAAANANGQHWGGMLVLSNVLITDSTADAIYWPGGGASLVDTKIQNAQGSAFVGRGGLLAFLDHVTGAGNAGVGIRSLDGAQIEKTPATTVTGSNDQQVGDLLPGPYPANPFSLYDITAVGPGGATGTGARLFDNTP